METFMKDIKDEEKPTVANVGFAGLVVNNMGKITNLPWPAVEGDKIGEQFGFEKFKLMNDFEIASYAVIRMGPNDVIRIAGPAEPDKTAIKVVTGPGTGLGMSMVVPN